MIKISSFLLLFIFISFMGTTQVKDQKETTIDIDLDRDFKASSTKIGIEDQVTELKGLIKDKKNEISSWDDVINDLQNEITNGKNGIKVNFIEKWNEIDNSLESPQTDYNSLYRKTIALFNYFSPQVGGYYYSENSLPSAIKRFNKSTYDKVEQVRIEIGVTGIANYYITNQNYSKADITNLIKFKSVLNDSTFKKFQEKFAIILSNQLTFAQSKKEEANIFIAKVYKKIEDLEKLSEDKDVSINQRAINIGLPLFCITVILLFFGSYLYRKLSVAQSNPQQNTVDPDDLISKVLLEVITVLLITMTVLILGLARILTENVLGTLLGGIAGYILNRAKKV